MTFSSFCQRQNSNATKNDRYVHYTGTLLLPYMAPQGAPNKFFYPLKHNSNMEAIIIKIVWGGEQKCHMARFRVMLDSLRSCGTHKGSDDIHHEHLRGAQRIVGVIERERERFSLCGSERARERERETESTKPRKQQ
jgi:hypothetical protein